MARGSGRAGARIGPPDRGKGVASRAPGGRVCDREGCSTILSTYNASGACWMHAEPSFRHALYRA
jgi:hypothetical protein